MECAASGHAGSFPFDEATVAAWKHGNSCETWLIKTYGQISPALRPPRDQIGAFALFLSSFFSTSFSVCRIQRHGELRFSVRSLPARRFDGSKKSNKAIAREQQAADTLRRFALESLVAECGFDLETISFSELFHNETRTVDATLWAYATQLVNRSQYASQGPAVYRLWLELPERIRRNLSADLVWQARERLIQFFQSLQSTTQL